MAGLDPALEECWSMVFDDTTIEGAYVILAERYEDERGFFARVFCQQEFEAHGLDPRVVQCGFSFNKRKGTIRGMHYQVHPYEEVKLVRCTKGSIYDVLVDLRPGSPTCRHWLGVELTADNCRMMYIPKGVAHGFQTLEDGAEVAYQMSEFYHPECSRGIRWNDPAFGVAWPIPLTVISDRDRGYPDFVI